MRDNLKITAGVVAIAIYLILISLVLYYFNYRSTSKSVHYVKKSSNHISVSLASSKESPKTDSKSTKISSSKQKKKHKPKKVRNITTPKQNPSKQRRKSKRPIKKIKTKDLFSSVKSPPKKISKTDSSKKASIKRSKTASQKISDSLKKPNNSDKGIENKYFASVEEKLRGWPEQVNYAGEKISVMLTVYSSGSFEFKVQRLSSNSEFNEALIAYLKQLQEIGLGRHTNTRPYEIEVEFEATQ